MLEVSEQGLHYEPVDGKHYVLLVNERHVVEWREVKPGDSDGDRRIINEGLRADDWVIVGGGRAPQPGDRVEPKRLKAPDDKE